MGHGGTVTGERERVYIDSSCILKNSWRSATRCLETKWEIEQVLNWKNEGVVPRSLPISEGGSSAFTQRTVLTPQRLLLNALSRQNWSKDLKNEWGKDPQKKDSKTIVILKNERKESQPISIACNYWIYWIELM